MRRGGGEDAEEGRGRDRGDRNERNQRRPRGWTGVSVHTHMHTCFQRKWPRPLCPSALPLPWPIAAGHGDGLVLEHPWLWLGSPLWLRAKAADKRAWNI